MKQAFMIEIALCVLPFTLAIKSSLRQAANESAALDFKPVRYFATTDGQEEVDQMSTALTGLVHNDHVHVVSVTGGMSGLSLLGQLENRQRITVTFFDYLPEITDLAELYIELIKASPTRKVFLERFFARKLAGVAGEADVVRDSDITPETMRQTFYDSPLDSRVHQDVLHMLKHNPRAYDLYANEMTPKIARAKNMSKVPAAWPCWRDGLDPKTYGSVFGNPYTDLKTSTLWYGQSGFLKNDRRYNATRNVVSKADIDFRTARLDAQDLSALAVPPSNRDAQVVVFTSNALSMTKWVPDGLNHNSVGKRLGAVFTKGGIVLETRSFKNKLLQSWDFGPLELPH